MKLLFDQNISYRILRLLPEEFSDSAHIKSEGLINSSDFDIWEFAKKKDYIIVTQDSDFNDLNSLYGFPPKIIWIRAGNLKTHTILKALQENLKTIDLFLENNKYGCFEINQVRNN